jgi:hypothetical protein
MAGVNRVMLGARVIGYEMFNLDKQEVIGYTEKQLKDAIQGGDTVYGLIINEAGQIDLANGCNIMNKIGINTFNPMNETSGFVTDMYSLIGVKEDKGNKTYTFINQRFGRKELNEKKLLALLELSDGLNGVSLEGDTVKTWFDPPAEQAKPDPDTKKK